MAGLSGKGSGLPSKAAPRHSAAFASIPGILFVLILGASGFLDRFENMSFDLRARLFSGAARGESDIALVYLDQYSLDWAQKELDVTWPWPREMYGLVAEFCSRARSTSFDVLFAGPSSYGVDDDRAFAEAIAGAGNVVLSGLPPGGTGLAPEIAAAKAPEGSVVLKPDRDGVFRHYLPFGEEPKLLRPSLGLAAFAGKDRIGYEPAKTLVTVADLDGRSIAFRMDAAKGVVPRYARSEGVFRRYNAAELISSAISMRAGRKPQLDPGVFDAAFVLFGYSAPGLYDRQATPLSASVPGVDIHAFFLRSLLDSSFLCRVPSWLDHALALILALASGLLFSRSRSTISRTATAICGMAAMPAAGLVAYALGYWIGIVESGLATLFALASILGAESVRTGRQRSFLRNAFGYYLSPRVIEKIIENPKSLSLGGERRRISVMFTDLEGFTAIAERLDPERLASLLNEYLSAMSDIIFEEGGTIDKYEGDAIIAFWNAPLEQDDHVLRAVTAALRCRERLESIRSRLADLAGPTHDGESGAGESCPGEGYSGDETGRAFRMRIGIHTGMAVVGNMGSRSRFNYTVLGDTVNLASRLEGVNKVFGTSILVSAEVVRALGFSSMRRIARVAVVGRREAVDIYEPLGLAPKTASSEDASFGAALELFEKGEFGRAAPIFAALSSRDPVSAAYVEKCAALEAGKPEFWNGVWVLESK